MALSHSCQVTFQWPLASFLRSALPVGIAEETGDSGPMSLWPALTAQGPTRPSTSFPFLVQATPFHWFEASSHQVLTFLPSLWAHSPADRMSPLEAFAFFSFWACESLPDRCTLAEWAKKFLDISYIIRSSLEILFFYLQLDSGYQKWSRPRYPFPQK